MNYEYAIATMDRIYALDSGCLSIFFVDKMLTFSIACAFGMLLVSFIPSEKDHRF